MRVTLRREGDEKSWPHYVLWGRMRTSTVVLMIAFVFTWWLYETYRPPPVPPAAAQTVPPGFVPDPDYTWVPRTNVETPRTTYPTSTTYPTTTYPTTATPRTSTPETTGPSATPTTSAPSLTTTVINPAPGLLPPLTLPVQPGPTPQPTPTPTAGAPSSSYPPPPARSAS